MGKCQDKERILKETGKKQEVTYKGVSIWLAADFSMEMLQARREWQRIFQVMKNDNSIQQGTYLKWKVR